MDSSQLSLKKGFSCLNSKKYMIWIIVASAVDATAYHVGKMRSRDVMKDKEMGSVMLIV